MQASCASHGLPSAADCRCHRRLLCCAVDSKTKFCVDLMRQHVVDKEYWASVWFMSHTSSDPSVGLSGDIITGVCLCVCCVCVCAAAALLCVQ